MDAFPPMNCFCTLAFSANFQLIAAMNPYPCGNFGDPQKACGRAPAVVTKYQKRISGPMLDRIDIHVEVPRVDYEELSGDRVGESRELFVLGCKLRWIYKINVLQAMASRILCAMRICVSGRYGSIAGCRMKVSVLSLSKYQSQMNLSARAYHRILKLARTIADMAGSEETQSAHLAEALHASQSFKVDDG